MLGLADYGSSDEEDTKQTTKTQTTINKDIGNQSKKRVINVSLPLAFGSKAEQDADDEEDARPVKKANTGFSLSNLLPEPKNAPSSDNYKKNTKQTTPTPPQTQTKITTSSTTVAGPTKNKPSRTSNPLLHLHKQSNTTKTTTETENKEQEEEIDSNDFFPIAAAAAQPVRPTPAPIPQQQQQQPIKQPQVQPKQQVQQQPAEQTYDEQAYYAQQQQAYPDYSQYEAQQQQHQQYYQQQQQYYQQQQYQQPAASSSYTQEFLNDPSMQQGIHNPYQGKSKREIQMDSLGANVVEVNQTDILKTNRPVYDYFSSFFSIPFFIFHFLHIYFILFYLNIFL